MVGQVRHPPGQVCARSFTLLCLLLKGMGVFFLLKENQWPMLPSFAWGQRQTVKASPGFTEDRKQNLDSSLFQRDSVHKRTDCLNRALQSIFFDHVTSIERGESGLWIRLAAKGIRLLPQLSRLLLARCTIMSLFLACCVSSTFKSRFRFFFRGASCCDQSQWQEYCWGVAARSSAGEDVLRSHWPRWAETRHLQELE